MCVYAFIRKKNWNQNLYCFPIEFPYSRFVQLSIWFMKYLDRAAPTPLPFGIYTWKKRNPWFWQECIIFLRAKHRGRIWNAYLLVSPTKNILPPTLGPFQTARIYGKDERCRHFWSFLCHRNKTEALHFILWYFPNA